MDEFGEGIGNPFDTPIPGQSLTDEPGNYPWEHPPQYVTTDGAADHLWNRMSEPEFAEQIIAMLDAGVPVGAIARTVLFGGFLKVSSIIVFISLVYPSSLVNDPEILCVIARTFRRDWVVKKDKRRIGLDVTN